MSSQETPVAPENIFPGARKFSCERQDEFIYHLIAKHLDKPGTFLDIGCGHPKDASNTYVLEKYCGWHGLGFDIGDVEIDCQWSEHRNTPTYRVDATSNAFSNFLSRLPTDFLTNLDYISLDVDSNETNYSAIALQQMLTAGIQFKAMTLEHESFKHSDTVTGPSRAMLHDRGYAMLFEDVCFEDGNAWEDWWINPNLIPIKNIMSIQSKGETFNSCIDKLISFTKA